MDTYFLKSVRENLFYLVILLLSVLFIKYNWDRRKLYIFSWKTPGPFAIPIFGNVLSFTGNDKAIWYHFQECMDTYKTSMRVWFGPWLVFMIREPDEVAVVMNQCLNKARDYEIFEALVGCSLFTATEDTWRIHRKILTPAFSTGILNSYLPVFEQHCRTLVETLRESVGKSEFNLFLPVHLTTLDIIRETAMGLTLEEHMQGDRFIEIYDRLKDITTTRMVNIWYRLDFIFKRTALGKELYTLKNELNELINKVIQDKKREMKKHKEENINFREDDFEKTSKGKSFLELVLILSEEGAKFSDQDCIDEVNTFMLAGSDSTATATCFVALALAMHPEIQDKVFEELDEVFGDSNRPVTLEDLSKLKYLERVFRETLRIFPGLLAFGRKCDKDLKLNDGTIVPAGVSILIDSLHLHRSPVYWKDPLKFDPDRFLPDNIKNQHPYAQVAFSCGPRNCIGMRYAIMSVKVMLSTILRTYKFKTHYKKVEDVQLEMHSITRPLDGFMLEIEYRK